MIEEIKETYLWDYLKEAKKPIVLYGMGDGADLIIKILDEKGIKYNDIFASDEFVRGHFFHGKKVLKFSEIKEKYEDFIILLTFAFHDRNTLLRIKKMSEEYELYSPCVGVIGNEYFTKNFLYENKENLEKAYSLLSDEKSKNSFKNVLLYKLSGKIKYLFECEEEKEEIYKSIFPLNESEIILDLGAYDGDSIREFMLQTEGKYKKIYAFEPDEKNFKKLLRKQNGMENLTCFNIGAWNKEETLYFKKKNARGSRTEKDGTAMSFNSPDNLINDKVTFIKMDIEGAELKALEGSKRLIKENLPKLYICAYHKDEDMFTLPLKIFELSEKYKIYYRHHPYIPAFESNFYCVAE